MTSLLEISPGEPQWVNKSLFQVWQAHLGKGGTLKIIRFCLQMRNDFRACYFVTEIVKVSHLWWKKNQSTVPESVLCKIFGNVTVSLEKKLLWRNSLKRQSSIFVSSFMNLFSGEYFFRPKSFLCRKRYHRYSCEYLFISFGSLCNFLFSKGCLGEILA